MKFFKGNFALKKGSAKAPYSAGLILIKLFSKICFLNKWIIPLQKVIKMYEFLYKFYEINKNNFYLFCKIYAPMIRGFFHKNDYFYSLSRIFFGRFFRSKTLPRKQSWKKSKYFWIFRRKRYFWNKYKIFKKKKHPIETRLYDNFSLKELRFSEFVYMFFLKKLKRKNTRFLYLNKMSNYSMVDNSEKFFEKIEFFDFLMKIPFENLLNVVKHNFFILYIFFCKSFIKVLFQSTKIKFFFRNFPKIWVFESNFYKLRRVYKVYHAYKTFKNTTHKYWFLLNYKVFLNLLSKFKKKGVNVFAVIEDIPYPSNKIPTIYPYYHNSILYPPRLAEAPKIWFVTKRGKLLYTTPLREEDDFKPYSYNKVFKKRKRGKYYWLRRQNRKFFRSKKMLFLKFFLQKLAIVYENYSKKNFILKIYNNFNKYVNSSFLLGFELYHNLNTDNLSLFNVFSKKSSRKRVNVKNNTLSHKKENLNSNYFPFVYFNKKIKMNVLTKLYIIQKDTTHRYLQFYINSFISFYSQMKSLFLFYSNHNGFKGYFSNKLILGASQVMAYFDKINKKFFKKFQTSRFLEFLIFSFFQKDLNFFIKFFKLSMELTNARQHKKILYSFEFMLRKFLDKFFFFTEVRGLKFEISGKISVTGNSKTRNKIIRFGYYSLTKKNLKIDYLHDVVRTFTGVLGFKVFMTY